jgi:hypothetical protein
MATRPSNLIVMSKIPGSGSVVMPGGPVPDPIGDDPGIHRKKNIFDQ